MHSHTSIYTLIQLYTSFYLTHICIYLLIQLLIHSKNYHYIIVIYDFTHISI
jgi:hypothetical protein